MRIYTSMKRSLGSKYRWSFGKKGNIRSRVRDYILHELGTDDNFGGDMVYDVVDGLDKKFLQDVDLGAGLAVCLYEVGEVVEVLSLTGAAGMDVNKYISEKEQEAVQKATQFFGSERKDYQPKLEEMLNQWKNQQDARQPK